MDDERCNGERRQKRGWEKSLSKIKSLSLTTHFGGVERIEEGERRE
jgi:hypothetical protein